MQTGFNQMVLGLAERDRIRDLFGRHVGEGVARQALDEGVTLGGEVREVAVLFVDVIGSTSFAEQTPPHQVHPDPHTAALAAGRELARRLMADGGLLPAGIGVSSGRVVAGNIGAAERLQYTVIGDPVNEAARLTGRAKAEELRLIASAATVAKATGDEQACWQVIGEEVLRGRSTPTALAVPAARPPAR
ncbi:hypothetical protein BH23ACT9_BH23ACT9_06100 [soil metagenome]